MTTTPPQDGAAVTRAHALPDRLKTLLKFAGLREGGIDYERITCQSSDVLVALRDRLAAVLDEDRESMEPGRLGALIAENNRAAELMREAKNNMVNSTVQSLQLQSELCDQAHDALHAVIERYQTVIKQSLASSVSELEWSFDYPHEREARLGRRGGDAG